MLSRLSVIMINDPQSRYDGTCQNFPKSRNGNRRDKLVTKEEEDDCIDSKKTQENVQGIILQIQSKCHCVGVGMYHINSWINDNSKYCKNTTNE